MKGLSTNQAIYSAFSLEMYCYMCMIEVQHERNFLQTFLDFTPDHYFLLYFSQFSLKSITPGPLYTCLTGSVQIVAYRDEHCKLQIAILRNVYILSTAIFLLWINHYCCLIIDTCDQPLTVVFFVSAQAILAIIGSDAASIVYGRSYSILIYRLEIYLICLSFTVCCMIQIYFINNASLSQFLSLSNVVFVTCQLLVNIIKKFNPYNYMIQSFLPLLLQINRLRSC